MGFIKDNNRDFFGIDNKVFNGFLDRGKEFGLKMQGFTT